MYKVNAQTLSELVERSYYKKMPLMIFGPPGCAKSAVVLQTAQRIAEQKNRKFVNWADTSIELKKEIILNAKDWFVFCDQRISQMDSTDLRGIPNLLDKEMLETIPMSWIIYFTQPQADGFMFFDEINLAAPIVAGSAYQIIHDRAISDRRLAPEVFLIAAGNRQTDKAYTFDMPFPLKDRFSECEVYPDVESWTEWASGKINPHIIAFVNWKESYLFKVNEKGADKGSTPRGWERGSRLISDDYDIASNKTHAMLSIAVGEAAATEFKAYVKHFKSLDWSQIYKNPETVKGFEVDKLFAVAGGIAEQYKKDSKQDKFESIIQVVEFMPVDFSVITLRMMQRTDVNAFRKNIRASKSFKNIAQKFGKFIID